MMKNIETIGRKIRMENTEKTGYYTIYRICKIVYRAEDVDCIETLEEAKDHANKVYRDCLDYEWLDEDWEIEDFVEKEDFFRT